MEVIKKTILQALTTGTTIVTGATKYIIIPDLNAVYHLKFGLASNMDDIGFFDTYPVTGTTAYSGDSVSVNYLVTGMTASRLSELRKFAVTSVFENMYFNNGSVNNDGVVYSESTSNDVTYYLGGIKYRDIVIGDNTTTTYSFNPRGYNSLDFIDVPYYKNPNKEGIISNPKIDDDVFITRQESSAFENNYRLEYVKNLNDLVTYAGGNYFKIVNNT